MRHSLPGVYPSGNCVMLLVDRDLLPVIASQLLPLLQARLWETDSFEAGFRAICEVFSQMTNTCLTTLVQEIRDFRGVKSDFELTPVEERTSDMYNSLNDSFAALLAARGIMSDGWFTDTYATLTDVIQANRGNNATTGDETLEQVKSLIDSEADLPSILSTLSNFLGDQEVVAVETGLGLANIAMLGAVTLAISNLGLGQVAITTRLDAIVEALRGATAPDDNILQALRGDTPADADRNIVEQLI